MPIICKKSFCKKWSYQIGRLIAPQFKGGYPLYKKINPKRLSPTWQIYYE